jgi:hypothetical protein
VAEQSIKAMIDPADIAALAVFLASDAAKSISGQVVDRQRQTAGVMVSRAWVCSLDGAKRNPGSTSRAPKQLPDYAALRPGHACYAVLFENFSVYDR